MAVNELLRAMSDMLDDKLASCIKPVEDQLDRIGNKIDMVEKGMEKRLDKVEERLGRVEKRLDEVEERLDKVEVDIGEIKSRVINIEITLESDIRPRLSTIESCYTDTYKRYEKYTGKMDRAFDDIDVIQTVIKQHSEKLQKLA